MPSPTGRLSGAAIAACDSTSPDSSAPPESPLSPASERDNARPRRPHQTPNPPEINTPMAASQTQSGKALIGPPPATIVSDPGSFARAATRASCARSRSNSASRSLSWRSIRSRLRSSVSTLLNNASKAGGAEPTSCAGRALPNEPSDSASPASSNKVTSAISCASSGSDNSELEGGSATKVSPGVSSGSTPAQMAF